jgi:patatin-related protein
MSDGNVREIRLGLVCYGGVSLAIYMHGMTKELQKLVIASRALEADPENNTLPKGSSEHAYWEVLKEAQRRSPDAAMPRVVIDVVAGTSAGGINGVILCKALAHNLSQDSLRDLWFEKGDIGELLGGSFFKETARVTGFIKDLLENDAQGLLDGNAMLGWLLDALKQMDGNWSTYHPLPGEAHSLMPEDHPLQLFVTTTDYFGYRQYMTINDPPAVSERRNRHVLNFNYERRGGETTTQFDEKYNGALAFAARSTSSFPGAFPPLRLADAKELPADVKDKFFRAYELSGADPSETYFIDGGVLNNYPFQPAIDAIVKLRAESEVHRYLLYLQPDPGEAVQNPTGGPPNYFGTIWAGLSSVAASQPILEELISARSFNERVRRVDELVASQRGEVEGILRDRLPGELGDRLLTADQAELSRLRIQLDSFAEAQAGYLYSPYYQLRVHSVVEQLAVGICQLCNYKEEQSNLAFLIRLIVDSWARDRKLVGANLDQDRRRQLLMQLDLGYTRRRFAFVLQGINHFYGAKDAPPRKDLDRAKKALYDRIAELNGMIEASSQSVGNTVAAALLQQFPITLAEAVPKGMDLQKFADDFVSRNEPRMTALTDQLGAFFRAQKDRIHAELYEDFRTITAGWTPEQRKEVMLRYLGFPFWDAMIYPTTRLSEAGELRPLNIVRMSPDDSTLLGLDTAQAKLKGVKFGHFGAFLHREWRENDYLWGRLDAAERLVGLVLRKPGEDGKAEAWEVKPVLAAILQEEKPVLNTVQDLVKDIQRKVDGLPDGSK